MNDRATTPIETEERVVRPEDVHDSYSGEFLTLSPNSRRVVSEGLLEDIRKLQRE